MKQKRRQGEIGYPINPLPSFVSKAACRSQHRQSVTETSSFFEFFFGFSGFNFLNSSHRATRREKGEEEEEEEGSDPVKFPILILYFYIYFKLAFILFFFFFFISSFLNHLNLSFIFNLIQERGTTA